MRGKKHTTFLRTFWTISVFLHAFFTFTSCYTFGFFLTHFWLFSHFRIFGFFFLHFWLFLHALLTSFFRFFRFFFSHFWLFLHFSALFLRWNNEKICFNSFTLLLLHHMQLTSAGLCKVPPGLSGPCHQWPFLRLFWKDNAFIETTNANK